MLTKIDGNVYQGKKRVFDENQTLDTPHNPAKFDDSDNILLL